MSDLAFGLTLLLVGMGGTLLTLWVLTLILHALTRLLPPPRADSPPPHP